MLARNLPLTRPALMAVLIAMTLLSPFISAQPTVTKDTIIWLLRDMPPLSFASGPRKGQGAIDQLMPLLTARMPEYNHLLMHVNRARGLQMLSQPSFTCDPTLLWTAARAKFIAYSIPTYASPSNGIVIRREALERFTPFVRNGQIDLRALLASRTLKLGLVAERNYGPVIDQIIRDASPDMISLHYGENAIGSLLHMERLGRIQALISYWPEARFQAMDQNMDPDDWVFYPIRGVAKYQFTHVGCSDTDQGRKAIAIINREMRVLRQTALITLYANWMDPASRQEYLEDAKAFFESP